MTKDIFKKTTYQGHFLSTHCFPPSSYSCFEIHICWNVPWKLENTQEISEPKQALQKMLLKKSRIISRCHQGVSLTSDARMEPPIQALNRRSTVVLLAISFSLML